MFTIQIDKNKIPGTNIPPGRRATLFFQGKEIFSSETRLPVEEMPDKVMVARLALGLQEFAIKGAECIENYIKELEDIS
jgi:hypothetical protein